MSSYLYQCYERIALRIEFSHTQTLFTLLYVWLFFNFNAVNNIIGDLILENLSHTFSFHFFEL